MADVSLVISALTIAAALSLVVERILEVIKHFREEDNAKIEGKQVKKSTDDYIQQAKQLIKDLKSVADAYQTAKKLDKLSKAKPDTTPELPPLPATAQMDSKGEEKEDTEFERHEPVTIIAATAKPLGEAQTALVLALLAAGFGIILAQLFDLRLISLFLNREVPVWADIMLTGIVIGGGSQPIHVLLRFLTSRRIPVTEQPKSTEPEPEPTIAQPAVPPPPPKVTQKDDSHWQPIAYTGGVKPESLEQYHLRTQEPDLIVYHHTAMSSNVPFQGVVDEFLVNKGWLTGYNCVIMPDGAIKPFCRWDRYGNHAKGLNQRSLGIAFHGNFHTLPNDRYSNHDGRFGFQKPTAVQLDAGARVVALWIHLYPKIQLDFNLDILPHKTAMPGHTVCPGSNFPYEEFENKVSFYYTKWEKPQAQEQIALFKQKPYIYANA
jgi:hypothetical protein